MRVEKEQQLIFFGLATVGAGFALVHFLKAPNPSPTLAAPLTGHTIKPLELPETRGIASHAGAICVRPEIVSASTGVAGSCGPINQTVWS